MSSPAYEMWYEQFAPVLRGTRRWDGFEFMAQRLLRLDKPKVKILETGCVRAENDWEGAGMSTMQWNWMVENGMAEASSIDISTENTNLARKLCPHVQIIPDEAIKILSSEAGQNAARGLDLLFLDSYDHNPPYAPSELHAAGELAAVWEVLPSGCFVMVDDCNGDGTGKHYLIRHFFDRLKVKPLHASYLHIWRKP